jgi:hypothetical protein
VHRTTIAGADERDFGCHVQDPPWGLRTMLAEQAPRGQRDNVQRCRAHLNSSLALL